MDVRSRSVVDRSNVDPAVNVYTTSGINACQISAADSPHSASETAIPQDAADQGTALLDIYIYDYLRKRNLAHLAQEFSQTVGLSFQDESIVVPLDLPGKGLLSEWWTVFWDFYEARTTQSSPCEVKTFMNMMRQMTKVQLQNKQNRISYEKRLAQRNMAESEIPDTTGEHVNHVTESPNLDYSVMRPTTPLSPQLMLDADMNKNSPKLPSRQLAVDPKFDILSNFLAILGFSPIEFNSLHSNQRRQIILAIETQIKICNQTHLPIFSPQSINNVLQQVSLLLSPELLVAAQRNAAPPVPSDPQTSHRLSAASRKRAKTEASPFPDEVRSNDSVSLANQASLVKQTQELQRHAQNTPNHVSRSQTYPLAGFHEESHHAIGMSAKSDPEFDYLDSLDPSIPIPMSGDGFNDNRKFIGNSYTLQRPQVPSIPESQSDNSTAVCDNNTESNASIPGVLEPPEKMEQDIMDEIDAWLNI